MIRLLQRSIPHPLFLPPPSAFSCYCTSTAVLDTSALRYSETLFSCLAKRTKLSILLGPTSYQHIITQYRCANTATPCRQGQGGARKFQLQGHCCFHYINGHGGILFDYWVRHHFLHFAIQYYGANISTAPHRVPAPPPTDFRICSFSYHDHDKYSKVLLDSPHLAGFTTTRNNHPHSETRSHMSTSKRSALKPRRPTICPHAPYLGRLMWQRCAMII